MNSKSIFSYLNVEKRFYLCKLLCLYSYENKALVMRQAIVFFRVSTAQGKWPEFPVRENREYGNFAKTQGIMFAPVVNSMILKGKGCCNICREILFRSWICLPSQFCVCYSHKSRKLAQGKFAVREGQHTKFENAI